jgi:hypothetical protein
MEGMNNENLELRREYDPSVKKPRSEFGKLVVGKEEVNKNI